ncbi:hypothetical protein QQF64_000819 [Cirrhinus molitorella]|uniref:Uncharacterized protein n=1 Tax=Cirrhinus molitorella TaxID=172907 RepID=A0ABR3NZ02_9TELE
MKMVILFACLLSLAFQAEVHQHVARSSFRTHCEESSPKSDPFYELLNTLFYRAPAPVRVLSPPATPSTAPTPVPTLAPITAR